jgi:hypothetical protein
MLITAYVPLSKNGDEIIRHFAFGICIIVFGLSTIWVSLLALFMLVFF